MPSSHDPTAVAALRETRLADYRPPAFLVDGVALDFTLDPHATVVRSRLELRRDAAGGHGQPLRLDGAGQAVRAIALDGAALGADRWRLDEGSLVIDDVPDT
ncbi:MAG: hypothetical protein ACRETZ_07980, partial [Steroidobacteraceae bacterium]